MLKTLFNFFNSNSDNNSFWGHVDQLRVYLIRSIVLVIVISIVAFFYKDFLFDKVLMEPSNTKFITYRILCKLGQLLNVDSLCLNEFKLSLINIELAGQFRYHILISVVAGIVIGFPIIIWQLWLFVKPALTQKEIRSTQGMVFYITILFLIGIAFGYYVITPLTINFLATYQLSELIVNQITIGSYISMVTILTLSMGLVFELPILIYFLTKIRLISSMFLKKYRKHSIVIIFIVAGFITPSTDMFSQALVALPLWFLYEIGILISKRTEAKSLKT